MAQKSVFIAKDSYPYFEEVGVEFSWFGGFARTQKQKNVLSLHLSFLAARPELHPLEVSSMSGVELGRKLSAMALAKETPAGTTCVESAFQASSVFAAAGGRRVGPFPELATLDGKACRAAVKERQGSMARDSYDYFGTVLGIRAPLPWLFYNWLYLTALTEKANAQAAHDLLESGFDSFTDLATKSLNTQARAAAIYVGLARAGRLDALATPASYLEEFRCDCDGKPLPRAFVAELPLPDAKGMYEPRRVYRTAVDKDRVEEIWRGTGR